MQSDLFVPTSRLEQCPSALFPQFQWSLLQINCVSTFGVLFFFLPRVRVRLRKLSIHWACHGGPYVLPDRVKAAKAEYPNGGPYCPPEGYPSHFGQLGC